MFSYIFSEKVQIRAKIYVKDSSFRRDGPSLIGDTSIIFCAMMFVLYQELNDVFYQKAIMVVNFNKDGIITREFGHL